MATVEKTISSEYIYRGKILDLKKDLVTVKDGGTAWRELIEHKGAVCVVPVTKDNRVVMVSQFRKACEKVILEIPAGKLNRIDEDPLEAARRELAEETGFRAGSMELLSRFYTAIGYSNERISLYLATDLVRGETNMDKDEDIEIAEMDLGKLYSMCRDGKIEDAKTIIGIMMAADRLKENRDVR